MARNWLASAFLLFLISRQDLLVEAGIYNSNCPDFSKALGDGCTASSDCSSITCRLDFGQKDLTLEVQINKCESPVTITATIKVPNLHIDWSHEYSSGDIVQVPGFTFTPLGGSFSVGVYLQVVMTDNGDQLTLTVNLLGGAEIGDNGTYPVKATVLDGELPISMHDCGLSGIIRWWKERTDAIKAAVIIGGLVLLISLISCCYCCCCCCCCCNQPPAAGVAVVSNVAANSTNVAMNNCAPSLITQPPNYPDKAVSDV